MLHVNEDNNDELFRKAAEGFFLKADMPNWEDLTRKIETGVAQADEIPVAKKTPHKLPVSVLKWVCEKTQKTKSGFFYFFGQSWWQRKSKKKIDPAYILPGTSLLLRSCRGWPCI